MIAASHGQTMPDGSPLFECEVSELLRDGADSPSVVSTSWFDTPAFATLYRRPYATRAICWREGALIHASCFTEEKGPFGMRVLRFGGWSRSSGELFDVLDEKKASAASVGPLYEAQLGPFRNAGQNVTIEVSSNDVVVELPRTPRDYLASLGSQTRKHLPYYLRRLEREFPGRWGQKVLWDSDIRDPQFRMLLELSRRRVAARGETHGWNEEMIERRQRLIRQHGLLHAICIDDKFAAGTCSTLYGQEAFLLLIGHDQQYDKLSIGGLALWQTINLLIEKGIRRYHLLWGDPFYKRQFGGVNALLYTVTMYANAPSAALHRLASSAGTVRNFAGRGWRWTARRLFQRGRGKHN